MSEKKEENLCAGCGHWKGFATSAPEVVTGKCLRNPPVLDPANHGGASETPSAWIWPVTSGKDTCGEWLARPAIVEPPKRTVEPEKPKVQSQRR